MALINVYFLASAIVALLACLFLLQPTLQMAKEAQLKDVLVLEYEKITYVVFYSISALLAPILVVILASTAMTQAFIVGMYAGITDD